MFLWALKVLNRDELEVTVNKAPWLFWQVVAIGQIIFFFLSLSVHHLMPTCWRILGPFPVGAYLVTRGRKLCLLLEGASSALTLLLPAFPTTGFRGEGADHRDSGPCGIRTEEASGGETEACL